MNVSNVQALVWILPNSELYPSTVPHNNYLACIASKQSSSIDGAEISMKDNKNQEHLWKVDKCITKDNENSISVQEETNHLITLALKGYSSACLFFNIGGQSHTYRRRMEQKKLIFEELEKAIKPNTRIEYAYFSFTDSNCYDLRKETPSPRLSTKIFLKRGVDSWMEEVDSVADIWKEAIRREVFAPHVLKIRLTDNVTKSPGYLYLFDLFHPRFLPLVPEIENNQHLYYSFEKLRNFVDLAVSSPTIICRDTLVSIDDNVLTSLLAPFICGSGKLVLFNYFKEYPKNHKLEAIMALDFIETLRNIRSTSLPNSPIVKYNTSAELEERRKELQRVMPLIIINKTDEVNQLRLEYEENIKQQNIMFQYKNEKAELEKQLDHFEDISRKLNYEENEMRQLAVNKKNMAEEKNMELEKKLNVSNKELVETHKKLAQISKLFKKACNDATRTIQKIKYIGIERVSLLKNQLNDRKIKYQDMIHKLQRKNNQLQEGIKETQAGISKELEISKMEKNEIRAFLKILRDEVEQEETEQ